MNEQKTATDFMEWLGNQINRDDPVGDLAGDMDRDEKMPESFGSLHEIYDYLSDQNDMVAASLFFAWEEWSGGKVPDDLVERFSAPYEDLPASTLDFMTDDYAYRPRPKSLIDDASAPRTKAAVMFRRGVGSSERMKERRPYKLG